MKNVPWSELILLALIFLLLLFEQGEWVIFTAIIALALKTL